MTAPWHVSDTLAHRYAAGAAPETDAWSLEKHVESCGPCATRVSAAVRAGTAGPALAAVRADLLASLGHVPAGADAVAPATRGHGPEPIAHPPHTAASAAHPQAGTPAPAAHGETAATRGHGPEPFAHPPHIAASAAHPQGGTPAPDRPERGATAPGARVGTAATRGRGEPAGHPGPAPVAASPARPDPARAGLATGPGRIAVAHPLGRWARIWWAAGPALRGSWIVAVALVLGGAFALAHAAGFRGARSWLLAVSPLLPLAGVAVSYGRHADPLYEITAATPSGGLRLLLTRTAAVLGVCVPLLTAGGALLPPVAGTPGAAAWLLPGLALTLATLALGSFVGCRAAAATLGGGWLLAVAGPLLGPQGQGAAGVARYFAGPAVQSAWAAAALVCAALLALRRRSFDHLETR
ncbi:zf-HC2 domain-containing protein [Streptomyces tanashiensis]|uniref:zf-HC2 domain-containing protein n=1 Tax=Streptomyces tanashiensis TaxID=67367 RepID=UPI0034198355